MSSPIPEIVVSYGGGGDSTCVDIGIIPSLELRDEEVEEATSNLYDFLRSAFHLPCESRLTLHETESGRILSNETFRDPSFVSNFPRYWYLTAGNGFNAPNITSMFQSLSMDDSTFPSNDYSLSELLSMDAFSPPDLNQDDEFGDDDNELGDMFPSLMELSMGQSPSQEMDGSREDLMTLSLICNEEGHFGVVFRHFTVLASVLSSDQSSSEGGDSRSDSRASTHSTDSQYTTVIMSTLFVCSVTPGGVADIAGLQPGDIVYSVNGQSTRGCSTEDITNTIEESSRKLDLSVSSEKYDELLFLYPQYVNEPPGEYDRGTTEKIMIADIIVRTRNPTSPLIDDDTLSQEVTPRNKLLRPDHAHSKLRPSSADYNSYNRITTTIDSENNIHSLDVTSPLEVGSSEQSLSSGIEYNSSIEDILIRGSLADIPVEASPLPTRKFQSKGSSIAKNSSSDLSNKLSETDPGSQNWYSDDNNYIRYFPGAGDDNQFTASLPGTNGSSSNDVLSHSGDFPSAFVDPPSLGSKKTKFFKFKQTLKNLKGSSSNGHPKLEKTSSLGIVKTNSTSAIDRLKVTDSSNTNLSSRSRSTDLGKVRLKRSSLEALTKVSSEENVLRKRSAIFHKQNSMGDSPNDNTNLPPLNIETQLIPTLDFVMAPNQNTHETDLLVSNSQGSTRYQLTPDERNLSGDSMSSSRGGRLLGGRSYRSQRPRTNPAGKPTPSLSREGSEKEIITSSYSVNPSSNHTPVNNRRFSRDVTEHISPLLSKKSPARRTTSWQNRNSYSKLSNDSYSSQDRIYNFSLDENQPHPKDRDRQPLAKPHPKYARSSSVTDPEDPGQTSGRGFTSSIDQSYHRPMRPHSSGGKMSSRKAMSVHPHNHPSSSGSLSYDPHGYGEHKMHSQKPRRALAVPEKFTSVFHGPIHKKQDKDNGGKKPSDRSWRSLYAAIQKHWMVFYGSVQDALANNPLSGEPPLDLHQCMVKVMPNGYKNRKNVFKLTSVLDASECAIQSENEESMMTWMRIIHNLNRMMRIRMGPPQMGITQPHRNSTQEDPPKNQTEKKKMHRILTPQPATKKKSQDHTKDDPSRRQQLLERLKRGKKKKDPTEDIEVPCYTTFGKALEDCPASYENKSIPLVAMVCIQELEKHWIETEGLYRIAGPIGQVRTLAQELNKGHFNLLQGHHDAHVITAIMKKFLKELPDPLVPLDKYDDFIACAQNGGDIQSKTARMKQLVKELPPCHYHTLGFLIKHLTNIAAHHQVSKMNQHNLAIVFGPTVAHKAGDEVVVGEMNASIAIIKILMDNLNNFFPEVNFSAFRFEDDSNRSQNRYPFLKGKSDPMSQNDGYGARSQSPRKSWDGTYLNSLSRASLTMGSQETFLSNYEGNSQDMRRGHQKRRLASSRGRLANIEEPEKDFTSSGTSNRSLSTSTLPTSTLPTPISPSTASTTVVSPKRKISYMTAVSKAWDSPVYNDSLQSVNENSSITTLKSPSSHSEFSFSRPIPSKAHTNPAPNTTLPHPASQRSSKQYKNYSDVHHRRWSAIDSPRQGDIEIFGPTSSTNEWLHRSRHLEDGPESCL